MQGVSLIFLVQRIDHSLLKSSMKDTISIDNSCARDTRRSVKKVPRREGCAKTNARGIPSMRRKR